MRCASSSLMGWPAAARLRAQLAPGVEEVLVDGVAVGAQLQREDVDGDVVERDRHEDLALARRQVLLDRRRQRGQLLAALGLLARLGRERSGSCSHDEILGARRVPLPRVPRDLAGDLEDHELVGPGREAAEALEVVELGQDAHHRVVGALLRDVVELGAGERAELPAAAVQLVRAARCSTPWSLAIAVLLARVAGVQLLDPSPRRRITWRTAGAFDAHQLIVVRRTARRVTNCP